MNIINNFTPIQGQTVQDGILINNTEYPINPIYLAAKEYISNNFYTFVIQDLIQIGSAMQQYKKSFRKIESKDGKNILRKPEDIIRDIIVLQLGRYFNRAFPEVYHNGHTDVLIKNFDNCNKSILVECLRWDTYKVKKIEGVKTYKSKILQIQSYNDSYPVVTLITFVQNDLVLNCVQQAKSHTLACNPLTEIKDLNSKQAENYVYGFESMHATITSKNTKIYHLFYNFYEE